MKKILLPILFLTIYLTPAPSFAEEVFISAIIKNSDSDCAIELEIDANDQDGFDDNDRIEIDGDELVNFENLVNAGINDSDGNNDDGDRILATSLSFSDNENITGDLIFADENCVDFDDNMTVTYVDADDDEIDSIDTDDVDDFGSNDTAIIKSSANDEPDAVDLDQNSVTVRNNNGAEAVVGEGDEADDNEGLGIKCSLTPDAKGGLAGLPFLLSAFALVICILRRRSMTP